MHLENAMVNEISQIKKNTVWYHFYVESNKIKQMNVYNKENQTHIYRKQISGYLWGEERTEGKDKTAVMGLRDTNLCIK